MPDIFTKTTKKSAPADTPHHSSKVKHPVTILSEKPKVPGIFSAFSPLPMGATFENQEVDEAILLLLRKHFVTNLPWIIITSIGLLLPLFLIPFFRSDIFSSIFFIPDNYIFVLTLLYYLVIMGYAFTQFATWFYQIGLITTLRIIDVDFNTLLSRNVAFAELEDIVDVEIVQAGVLQNFFNYGNVEIQTEGIKTNIEFVAIPKPNVVADTISDLIRQRRERD